MYDIKDFNVQILFADNEIMDFNYENFTEEEVLKASFKSAKEAANGVCIESVKIMELGI